METIEIIGYNRANLGKKNSKKLREEGNVPCVVYGGNEQIHFHSPMILFRDLVYTPGANFVKLNIEGIEKDAILQDIQFHPVSEVILHADFLELQENKKIRMDIPVKIIGDSPGVQQGGKILIRIRKLSLMAYPKNMPSFVEVDISELQLGKSVSVETLLNDQYEILNSPLVSVVSVNVPRVKIEVEEEDEEGEEGEEGAEGAEGAETKEGSSAEGEKKDSSDSKEDSKN
ncbi:MAG: 50S ribosomal protein L25/general stress protein Ctc [Rhodothermaeota bacterium MED-G16]|nr:MAG: 50S ribosomal protein L25/general stress protein Ctc [Rhodothermaeota bacterium MED-G16]